MVKFKALNENGRAVYGLGLSYENLRRLRNGETIAVALEQIGGPACTIAIFAGQDEQTMAEELMDKNLIGPDTKLNVESAT